MSFLPPDVFTNFARATGLRPGDLRRIRNCHMYDDPLSDAFLIIYHRADELVYHRIPVLLDHEDVILHLLKFYQGNQDRWFPVLPADFDYQATRRYYVQHLYEQATFFLLPPLNRKKVLTWMADLLEEPVYGIIERYAIPLAPRYPCYRWADTDNPLHLVKKVVPRIDDSWPQLHSATSVLTEGASFDEPEEETNGEETGPETLPAESLRSHRRRLPSRRLWASPEPSQAKDQDTPTGSDYQDG